jgi:hypothetical protein
MVRASAISFYHGYFVEDFLLFVANLNCQRSQQNIHFPQVLLLSCVLLPQCMLSHGQVDRLPFCIWFRHGFHESAFEPVSLAISTFASKSPLTCLRTRQRPDDPFTRTFVDFLVASRSSC